MMIVLLAIGALCSAALIGPGEGSGKPTGLEGKLDAFDPKHFNFREFTRHPIRETGELYNDAMIRLAFANKYVPYEYVLSGPAIMAAVGVKRYLEDKGLHFHVHDLHMLPGAAQSVGDLLVQAPHLIYQGFQAIMAAFGIK